MATTNGTSGSDDIDGTTGADNLNGGAGNDDLYGDAGNDRLNGGSGTDTLDGGSGSDTLNGDSGDDLLIYRLCENIGAGDVYTGGSGIDTIQLMLTSTEWLKDSVQAELARYFAHLETVQRNVQCEVSNGSSRDFTFNFGYSTTLTVQMMEKLKIFVDGNEITDLDKPIVDLPDSKVLGSVVEDGSEDSDMATSESASGHIKFFDLDTADTHEVCVTAPAGAIGTFTATLTDVATGDGQGRVEWTYTLDDAAAQYLDDGETKTEEFVVKIKDDEGKFVTQIVTITIHGSNDGPVISVGAGDSAAEALDETDVPLTVSGTLTVVDADLSDAVDATVESVSAVGPTGSLSNADLRAMLTVTAGSIAADAGDANNLGWTFDSGSEAFDYLDDGESLALTYTVRATDDSSAFDEQTVTVTIHGSNDGPVISVGAGDSAVASLTESNVGLVASDTLTVTDIDVSDLVTPSVVAVSTTGPTGGLLDATLLAMMTVGPSPVDTTTTTTGQLTWSFDSGSEAFNFLNTDDTLELSYTIRATDDSSETDDQIVTITITGTNDAAVITGTSTGIVTEATASNPGTPTASGDLLATDVDNAHDAFQAVTTAAASDNGYGTFTLSADGQWVYTLDNTNVDVEALGAGGTLADSFTVYSEDGTSHEVSITINGADDRGAPTDIRVAASASGVSQQNFNFTFNATLFATDPDPGDPGDFTFTFGGGASSVVNGGNTFNISGNTLTSTGVLGQDANYTLVIRATQAGDPAGVWYEETFHIVTGEQNNTEDDLPGSAFDDVLYGGNNNDIVMGGNGDDSLFGQGAIDQLFGGEGMDFLYGGSGNDALDGGVDDDSLFGEADNDQLFGGEGSDDLDGGDGDDSLEGGAGDDSLIGGNGVDTASYVNASASVSVNLSAGAASGADGNDTLSQIENVTGSAFNDILVGNASGNVLVGGGGNDSLNGAAGQDTLTGGSGADTFVLNSADGDRITDFLSADDVLDFQQSQFPLANGWTVGGGIDSIVTVATSGGGGGATNIAGADLVIWNAGGVNTKDTAGDINTLLDNQNGTFNGGVFVLAYTNSVSGNPVALYYDADANDTGAGAGATLVAVFTNYTSSLTALGLPTSISDYISH